MITGRWIGYRYRGGRRTDEVVEVVAVDEKKPIDQLDPEEVLPPEVDVVEAVFTIQSLTPLTTPQSLIDLRRPCPPGYSIGHEDITAGTLGAWVERDGEVLVLSNNHVLANSNAGDIGDVILQPGAHDDPSRQQFGVLADYVTITFNSLSDKKDKLPSKMWWKLWKGIANFGAQLVGCEYRLVVVKPEPVANTVDAALCLPDNPFYVDLTYPILGIEVDGVRNLWLDDVVEKVGRTTRYTRGLVEGVDAEVTVNFDAGRTATFVDQVIIRGEEGDFSAGGDSGSAILSGTKIGGLLFAGGGGITIANRIENVQALLGFNIPV
jgi:hypothetical protein